MEGAAPFCVLIFHIPNPLMCLIKLVLYGSFMNDNDVVTGCITVGRFTALIFLRCAATGIVYELVSRAGK